MPANNMLLSMVIGAALSSGFRKTFGTARESVDRLGKTARRTEDDIGRVQRKQENLAASRQKVMHGMAVAAGAAYSIGRMFEKSMDVEEQVIRLRTVINAEDADAAVGRSIAHARETARKSLASESELLQIQYELNSAGLDEEAAQVGSDIVAKVAKVTAGDAGGAMEQAIASMGGDAGLSAAEQLAVLGRLQASLQGGEAGTALKSVAAASVKADEYFRERGIAVRTLDEAGRLRSFAAVVADMRRVFGAEIDEREKAVLQEAYRGEYAARVFMPLSWPTARKNCRRRWRLSTAPISPASSARRGRGKRPRVWPDSTGCASAGTTS